VSGEDPRRAALEGLSLAELEEAAGEIQRRVGVALRRIGERDADRPNLEGMTARRRAAELAVACEVAALALGSLAAALPTGPLLPPGHPTLAAALAYGAPTLQSLLGRLEQDRRVLASLARQLESRLETPATFGAREITPRRLLVEVLIEVPARAALELERIAGLREA
jgi:hypothetical protein